MDHGAIIVTMTIIIGYNDFFPCGARRFFFILYCEILIYMVMSADEIWVS